MAQLNLYVTNELAEDLKQQARQAGLPLSRYVVRLLAPARQTGWPAGFIEERCGFLVGEDFPEPADPAPEPVESLE